MSCGSSNHLSKLQSEIQQMKIAAEKNQKHSIPAINMPAVSTYQAAKLRSPFENTNAIVNLNRSSNPLLIYPVSMLKFTGILHKKKNIIGYIAAPDNKIYQVSIGDDLGNRGGKVVVIDQNHIEILEFDSQNGEKPTQHLVTLQIKEETK
jgi:Tfp pilus assembly protein PilP